VPIIALFPFPVLEASMTSTLERSREAASKNRVLTWAQRAENLRLRLADKVSKIAFNWTWRKPATLRRG
jgi:hypothetical protein